MTEKKVSERESPAKLPHPEICLGRLTQAKNVDANVVLALWVATTTLRLTAGFGIHCEGILAQTESGLKLK